MQCHAIALGTTGTTYARQQLRHIERETRKKKEREKRKKGTFKKKICVNRKRNKYPDNYYE